MSVFLTQITVKIVRETDMAVLVTETTPKEGEWLPKSQITMAPADKAGFVDITLPEWLAIAKGFF
jgi:hypothetical protein